MCGGGETFPLPDLARSGQEPILSGQCASSAPAQREPAGRRVLVASVLAVMAVVVTTASGRGERAVSLISRAQRPAEWYKHVALRNPEPVWPQQTREPDAEAARRLGTQYQKAVRTIVSNLKRRQRKVNTEASQIAKAVTRVVTSTAVSSIIGNMALGIAERESRNEDGNSFLASKASAAPEESVNSPPVQASALAGREMLSPFKGHSLAAVAQLKGAKSKGVQERNSPQDQHREEEEEQEIVEEDQAPPELPSAAEDNEAIAGGDGTALSPMEQFAVGHNPAGTGGEIAAEGGQVSCAGCMVCPSCCMQGWVPGCIGYNETAPVGGAAASEDLGGVSSATVGEDLASAADGKGRLALDPGEVAAIDRRLAAQYRTTVRARAPQRPRAAAAPATWALLQLIWNKDISISTG